ncbi:MAG: hypothetical protein JKX91_12310 [Rhizobiaceae bacterium]|nr:hypothetical protein [Rhizobiaceae bacterium]
MILHKFLAITISIGALALTLPTNANAIALKPTADGDVQTFGGNNVDTTDTRIASVPIWTGYSQRYF